MGSITPDFEYFIRISTRSIYSHTWAGIFWLDLPLGILLCFLFHLVVRDPLFLNLPIYRSRLYQFTQFNWISYFKKNWLVVICSVIIGTVSHIVWDIFTHRNSFTVTYLPELLTVTDSFGSRFTYYELMQLGSSLVGAIAILIGLHLIPKGEQPPSGIRISYWVFLLIVSAIVLSLRIYAGLGHAVQQTLIIAVISSGLIALLLAGLLFRKPFRWFLPHNT